MPLETNKQQKKGRITQADQKIGARLRQAREEAQLSQQSLADHLGVSFQQIQKYENGVNRVSVAKLCMIAKLTKCQGIEFYEYAA